MGSAVKAVSRRVAEDGYAALAQTVGELAGGGVKPFDTYLPLGNKNQSLCIERVVKVSYLTVNLPILL